MFVAKIILDGHFLYGFGFQDGNFREEYQDSKTWDWGRISSSIGIFKHPCNGNYVCGVPAVGDLLVVVFLVVHTLSSKV